MAGAVATFLYRHSGGKSTFSTTKDQADDESEMPSDGTTIKVSRRDLINTQEHEPQPIPLAPPAEDDGEPACVDNDRHEDEREDRSTPTASAEKGHCIDDEDGVLLGRGESSEDGEKEGTEPERRDPEDGEGEAILKTFDILEYGKVVVDDGADASTDVVVRSIRSGLQALNVDVDELSHSEKASLVMKAAKLRIKHSAYKEKSQSYRNESETARSMLVERRRANREREQERARAQELKQQVHQENIRLQRIRHHEEMREKTFAFISKTSLVLVVGVWMLLMHWRVGLWRILDRLGDINVHWLVRLLPFMGGTSTVGWLIGQLLSPILYLGLAAALAGFLYLSGQHLLRLGVILLAAFLFGSSVARGCCYYVPLYLAQWLALLLLPADADTDRSYRWRTAWLFLASCALSIMTGWFIFNSDPLNPGHTDGWIDLILRNF